MAANLTSKGNNFGNNCVQAVQQFLNAYNGLRALRAEWTSENWAANLQDSMFTSNPQLTVAILTSLMNTFDSIDAMINSNTGGLQGSVGNLTNLYSIKS